MIIYGNFKHRHKSQTTGYSRYISLYYAFSDLPRVGHGNVCIRTPRLCRLLRYEHSIHGHFNNLHRSYQLRRVNLHYKVSDSIASVLDLRAFLQKTHTPNRLNILCRGITHRQYRLYTMHLCRHKRAAKFPA